MRQLAGMNPRTNGFLTSLILVTPFLGLLSACQPQDEISTYTVERISPPKEPFDTAKIAAELDRILAGMLPIDDQVYFFKLSGKKPAIDRLRDGFNTFLGSVSKGDTDKDPLKWNLPEGWAEKGPSEMRLNTIVVPDAEGELELAVSSLPISGAWEDFVSSNVNRWLGQLGQGELSRQKILNLTKKVDTKTGPATVVELAGVLQDVMPMNPHAQLAEREAAQEESREIAPSDESAESEISYTAPGSWQKGPAMPMREATYAVGDGEGKGEFTVSAWPAGEGSQMSDVMANVQRWAAQVGLPVDEKLVDLIDETAIDGSQGSIAKLAGPAGKAMLAAMVVRDEKVWFFKLLGDAALVEREEENFGKFLDSVRFE